MTQRRVLHSWKEISNYAGRGIRTIQRYEVQFGFPVHRPAAKSRAAVIAFSDEIDAWFNRAPVNSRSINNVQSRISIEQARQYLAIAAKAKLSQEVARAGYERCMEQASRVREMMMKIRNVRTACRALRLGP